MNGSEAAFEGLFDIKLLSSTTGIKFNFQNDRTTNQVNNIILVVGNNPCKIYMEGYSYSSKGKIIDLVAFSTLIHLLLGLSKDIPAVALLGETYGHPMYIGLREAKEILIAQKNSS